MRKVWTKRIDKDYSPGFFDEMDGYGFARSGGISGIGTRTRIRRRYRFAGRVQGVGFRYRARNAASRLGLTGWVTNCYDGSVEMEIQGTEAEINLAIQNTVTDSYIRIDVMDYFDVPIEEHEYDFYIK